LQENQQCPNIPRTITAGQYKIGIWSIEPAFDISAPHDYSDNYFSIVSATTAPYITVISPNGGERWEIGKTYNIAWKANGFDRVVISVTDYSCSSELAKTIATNISASQGSYSWTVPNDFFTSTANTYCLTHYGWKPGDNFKIFIAELTSAGTYGVRDESDNYFSIVAPTVGSLTVSTSPDNPAGQTVVYGTRYLELLRFNLTADPIEDIKVTGIATEFFSRVYGEILPSTILSNLRILYDNTQYGPTVPNLSSASQTAPDNSWAYSTTYVWFYGDLTIPRGSTRTLKLIADVTGNENIGINSIKALIPSWTGLGDWMFAKGTSAHFIAKGMSSGKTPNISGEASGNMFYFRKPSTEGSLTLSTSSEIPSGQTYSKGTNGAKLLKIDFTASPEEAIKVMGITIYISKDITDTSKTPLAGDLKNIKLIQPDGRVYGKVVSDIGDLPVSNGSRVLSQSSDGFVVNAGGISSLTLVADIPITTTANSFESYIPSANTSNLVLSIGLVSGKDIIEIGGADRIVNVSSGLGLKNIENQLASMSEAISGLMEQLKNLIGR
jgi:hypothetical protein